MKKAALILSLVGVLIAGNTTLIDAYPTRYGSPCILDDAGTEEKGCFELWSGIYQTWDPGLYTTSINVSLTYGITNRLEVFVSPEVHGAIYGEEADNETGHGSIHEFGDVYLGTKYQFREEEGNIPALASQLTLKIPTTTDDKCWTTGEVDYKVNLLATKSIGKAQINLNSGYTYVGEPEGEIYSNVVSYGVAFQYPVKKVILTTELVGKTNYLEKHLTVKENILDLYEGLQWPMGDDWSGDIAFGTRLSEADPDYLGYLGISYYF